MNVIYRPPLGTRRVHLRRDLRYGDDDFTLWPQPFSRKYCHHLAVPRKPEQPDDPLTILWWDPSPADFTPEEDSTITGLGKLSSQKVAALEIPYKSIRARVKEFRKTHPENRLVSTADVAVRHALTRLQCLATSYKEMVYGVTEFQRFALELTALLDYQLIFYPRLEQNEIKFHEPANVIGAFTTSPQTTQICFQAGIPVWFCRPVEGFPDSTNILAEGDCRQPQDFVVLEEWPEIPTFPIIFSGSASDEHKITAMHNYTRTWLQYPDPFRATEDPFLVGGRIPTTSLTQTFEELDRGVPERNTTSSHPAYGASSSQSALAVTLSSHAATVGPSLRVPSTKKNQTPRHTAAARKSNSVHRASPR